MEETLGLSFDRLLMMMMMVMMMIDVPGTNSLLSSVRSACTDICLDLCDPKRSRPVNMLALLILCN